jgi:hypothetical protein
MTNPSAPPVGSIPLRLTGLSVSRAARYRLAGSLRHSRQGLKPHRRTNLLAPQRHQRVHVRSTVGRHVAGCSATRPIRSAMAANVRASVGVTPKRRRVMSRVNRNAPSTGMHQWHRGSGPRLSTPSLRQQTFARHRRRHPDSHTDSDVGPTLRDRVGHDTRTLRLG